MKYRNRESVAGIYEFVCYIAFAEIIVYVFILPLFRTTNKIQP